MQRTLSLLHARGLQGLGQARGPPVGRADRGHRAGGLASGLREISPHRRRAPAALRFSGDRARYRRAGYAPLARRIDQRHAAGAGRGGAARGRGEVGQRVARRAGRRRLSPHHGRRPGAGAGGHRGGHRGRAFREAEHRAPARRERGPARASGALRCGAAAADSLHRADAAFAGRRAFSG